MPYCTYDACTLAAYERHGLNVLLIDLNANDGMDCGFKASLRTQTRMSVEIANVRACTLDDELLAVEVVMSVVVAFHDTNSYTAEYTHEYVEMALEAARVAELQVDAEPFYTWTTELEIATLARAWHRAP